MPDAVTGTVTELHRWPVKSLGGEPVDELRVDDRGAGGDRTHAIFDVFKGAPRRLTARQAPRLLAWHASYEGADVALDDPPTPTLTDPGGTTWDWDDPALPGALARDLGREVTLRRDVTGQQDLPRSLLLTTQVTLDALGDELGGPIDLRRFRTNVHAVLDEAPAYAEHGWEGRTLRIGEAELTCLHPCARCVIPTRDPDTQEKWATLLKHVTKQHGGLFGMNVRVTGGAARIRMGDAIELGL